MPAAPDAPDGLTVLTCPNCGAKVPVDRAAQTPCVYCRELVPVPEAYREALQLAEREVEVDDMTRRAFRTLGKPPSWFLRLTDFLTTGCYVVFTTLLLVFGGAVKLFNWLLDECTPLLHVNAWDWLSYAEQNLMVWGSSFAVLLALFALGAFGRRHVSSLRGLQGALSARPSARKGGPAECRLCGAPLSVPANALGVRCAYCRTDNLVSIPAPWLERKRGALTRVAREAKILLKEYRVERRKLIFLLAFRLLLVGGVAVFMLEGLARRVISGEHDVFDLRSELGAPRELFDVRANATLAGTPSPPLPTIPINQCASNYVLRLGEDLPCLDEDCWAGWFVALHAGETVELVSSAAGSARFVAHYKDRGWTAAYGRSALWGDEISRQAITPERDVRFRAPNTSWYRVELELKGVTEDVLICAKIH